MSLKQSSGDKPKISLEQRFAIDRCFMDASEKLDELWAGLLSYAPPQGISKSAMNRVCEGVTRETFERLKCRIFGIIENG